MSDVLVVDDDPFIREFLQVALTTDGIPHRVADNGVAALRELDAQRPALVLLDINMPVLDGVGFCHILQDRGMRDGLPVVVMTAANDIAGYAEACGADDVLPKPFDIDALYAVLTRFGILV